MTSSLVGSEMCIRDRGKKYSPPPVGGPPPMAICHILAGKSYPGIHIPVSYTHLTLPTICSV
eukprot:1729821-Prorocentrum_lima.AAC.1